MEFRHHLILDLLVTIGSVCIAYWQSKNKHVAIARGVALYATLAIGFFTFIVFATQKKQHFSPQEFLMIGFLVYPHHLLSLLIYAVLKPAKVKDGVMTWLFLLLLLAGITWQISLVNSKPWGF